MYTSPSQMEPMLPPMEGAPPHILEKVNHLSLIAERIIRKDAELSKSIHFLTAQEISLLVSSMNCYYSNLIEGHGTQPADIERALKNEFVEDIKQRDLQKLAIAHIQTDCKMQNRLLNEPNLDVCSTEFLCWLHQEFYSGMDKSAWGVENIPDFTPGRIRNTSDVNKGLVALGTYTDAHIPPDSKTLPLFLSRFQQAYTPKTTTPIQLRLIMAAASHHRLAWIHPFLDGNGRVTRLFSSAYLNINCNIGKTNLWSLSRGLSRSNQYKAMMMMADSQRRGDLDGRGNLSTSALTDFCEYFFNVIEDQIDFMSQLLDIDGMKERISNYVNIGLSGKVKPQAEYLLREAFVSGSFQRGEAARLMNMPERSARDVLTSLINLGLLESDTPKGAVKMKFPSHSLAYLLPDVFPAPRRPVNLSSYLPSF